MNRIVNDVYMYVIGGLILVGFFAATIWLALNNTDGKYTALITDMVSTIKMSFILIVGYYWGSSKGSADKNNMLLNK